MWALVPIKRFDLAKGRLAAVLTAEQRHALVRAMAEDVLTSLAECPGIGRILVVTEAPEVRQLAASVGAELVADPGNGLNAAIRTGAEHAAAGGAQSLLVVHGDLPLASSAAFSRIVAAHPGANAVTIVPDASLDGSNCMALSPVDAIPFSYGRQSFASHRQAALARGLTFTCLEIPELALDIDSPGDLSLLLEASHQNRAVAFLRGSGIASRIASLPATASC